MNLKETFRYFKFYGETKTGSDPVRRFFWILNKIVMEDIDQATEILGKEVESGLLTYASIYAQRMIEMTYLFTEIFIRDEYKSWNPTSNNPRVIDLGGDPGATSALYWKSKKPNAVVTVVEANPSSVATMKLNISTKGIDGIEIVNAAISADKGMAVLILHKPGKGWHTQDFVGCVDSDGREKYRVSVPKLMLSTLIGDTEQVDLIKIDIEGAESDAIHDLEQSGKLSQVRQILMEFHHNKRWVLPS